MNERQAMIQIKKILRDNSFNRYTLSKRGSISFDRLAFYKTSKKIFKEQTAIGGKHYAFVLLLDCSGSMGNINYSDSKIYKARKTIRNIIGILGDFVKIDVILFSEGFIHIKQDEFMNIKTQEHFSNLEKKARGIAHYNKELNLINVKTFYNNSIIKGNKYDISAIGSNTNEPPALQYAYTLLKDFNGKKGIISIADGDNNCSVQPSFYKNIIYDMINENIAKEKDLFLFDSCGIKKEKYESFLNGINLNKYSLSSFKKNIDKISRNINYVLGIGLGTDYPKNHYDNFIRIDNPEEIYKYMVEAMKYLINN